MEKAMPPDLTRAFRGKRVFLTGHTGFKGSWLTLLLARMGAEVRGYSLEPPSNPSLFELARVEGDALWIKQDIRDQAALGRAVAEHDPHLAIHMAAQSLVRPSYEDPLGTLSTNVMGTANLLEACRSAPSLRAVVVVTSDKCYLNRGWVHGYRETDALGGHDPYSASKACAEIVASSFAASFFRTNKGAPLIASVRSGNVVGGGDFATDRLAPDLMRAFAASVPALIRHPGATRPWLHVLDSLHGYLTLAAALCRGRKNLAGAWNFAPPDDQSWTVGSLADRMAASWGQEAAWKKQGGVEHPHEAFALRLDASKARLLLGWRPRLPVQEALDWTVRWYKAWRHRPDSLRQETLAQIDAFRRLA
jgi:CDP-glucose 4,6-dehydratase